MNKLSMDFYFDFISPYSYMAAMRLDASPEQYPAQVNWLPVNLPKLIHLSGNKPPTLIKNKARYSLRDLKRWAEYLQLPFKMVLPGSFDSRPAMRTALALQGEERVQFCQAVFRAIWSGAVDPRQPQWLQVVVSTQQLPPAWLDKQDDRLDEMTQQALAAGAFGAPTFILHRGRGRPEMFFGLDHMDFLARACASNRSGTNTTPSSSI